MKKTLLFFLAISFTLSAWRQISEYIDDFGNNYEFRQATSPEFIEFGGNMYFISDLGVSNGSDHILRLDQYIGINFSYDTSSYRFHKNLLDLMALTVFEDDLYFAMNIQTMNSYGHFEEQYIEYNEKKQNM